MREVSEGRRERLVIVIDSDIATFKGISRIGEQAGFLVESFPDCQQFSKWISNKDLQTLGASCELCLVMDARALVPDMGWCANGVIRLIPKICIGTPAATSSMGHLINAFDGEFIRKPFTLAKIRNHIEEAFPRFVSMVAEELECRSVIGWFSLLTNREREVSELVGAGNSNLEIADELGITLKTVKAHRAKVMEKTRSDTIADFVRKYEKYRSAAEGREASMNPAAMGRGGI